MTWDEVVTRVEAAIGDKIDRAGAFRAKTHIGVLVCR